MDVAATPSIEALAVIPAARWWRGLPAGLIALVAAVILAAVAPDDSYYLNIIMQAATYAIGVAGLVVGPSIAVALAAPAGSRRAPAAGSRGRPRRAGRGGGGYSRDQPGLLLRAAPHTGICPGQSDARHVFA